MTLPHNNFDDKLALINAFVESAQHLSFNQAAKALSLTASTLSRRIKRLEESLGCQLFVRTTRRMALTEAGELYLHHAQRILHDLDEGDKAIASLSGKPSGVLRVNVPSAFGRICIAPAIPQFMCRYPDIQLDIHYTDKMIDLIEQRVDVAVRIGTPLDSSLKQRHLTSNVCYLVATPGYLATYGVPEIPEQLAKHKCLYFSHLQGENAWKMQKGERQVNQAIKPALLADDAQSLFDAACAGAGIAFLADFIVHKAVKAGRLKIVLPDWKIAHSQICAVYPGTSYVAPKTRVFIDFLLELFADIPVWQRG